MTETQKTKGRALRVASTVALAVVVIAPAAASWHGLVATGEDVLGLSGGWQYVVPLTLDGGAFYAAALAMRNILAGDSALGSRLLTALYALAAAGFQAYHAMQSAAGTSASAVYFAGASLSAVVLWDVTLRALRRDQLREEGLIEGPLPRWRALRWVVAPIETARAWRLAVVEGISDPSEALEIVRTARETRQPRRRVLAERVETSPALPASETEDKGEHEQVTDDGQSKGRPAGHAGDADARAGSGDVHRADTGRGSVDGAEHLGLADERGGCADDVPAPDLRRLTSKKAAVASAFEFLGRKDVPAALELLEHQGVTVDRSYAYTVPWTPAPTLRAVEGGAFQ